MSADYREQAYDAIMVRLGMAFKAGQYDLVEKLNAALKTIEEIWPDAVENSKRRHNVETDNG